MFETNAPNDRQKQNTKNETKSENDESKGTGFAMEVRITVVETALLPHDKNSFKWPIRHL